MIEMRLYATSGHYLRAGSGGETLWIEAGDSKRDYDCVIFPSEEQARRLRDDLTAWLKQIDAPGDEEPPPLSQEVTDEGDALTATDTTKSPAHVPSGPDDAPPADWQPSTAPQGEPGENSIAD